MAICHHRVLRKFNSGDGLEAWRWPRSAIRGLLEEGLVRAVGLSNVTPEQIAAFGAVCAVHGCQPPYNILEQGVPIAIWGGRRPSQMAPIDETLGWCMDLATLSAVYGILNEYVDRAVGPEFMAPPTGLEP